MLDRLALVLLLAFPLLSGCSGSAAKAHAETLRLTHFALGEWETFIEGDDEDPNAGCPGLIRNAEDGPAVHASCLRVGEMQHAGVAIWTEWATATLTATAGERFNVATALQHGAQLLDLWLEANDILPQLPDPPNFLLTLLGRGDSE